MHINIENSVRDGVFYTSLELGNLTEELAMCLTPELQWPFEKIAFEANYTFLLWGHYGLIILQILGQK